MRRNEPISKIMTPNPTTVHFGQPLHEVREAMAQQMCHHMPVVSGKKIVGMLTSTDLLRASYEWGEDPRSAETILDHTRSIKDVMTGKLTTIKAHDTVRDAVELFAKGSFHALPVVEDDDLVGIVTTTDVMNYLLEQY